MPDQPMTPEAIATVFDTVLNLDETRLSDNFFDIGGNSYTALALVAKLRAASGREVRLRDVIREPTPDGLAKLIAVLPPLTTGAAHA